MTRIATLTLLLAAALTAGQAAADCAPLQLLQWNVGPSGYPSSMAVGSDGNIYVLYGYYRGGTVRVYSSDGALLHQWEDSFLWYPYDIAADAQGNVYVTSLASVNKYTSTGTFIRGWGPGLDCQFGIDSGSPTAITVDAQGNVYAIGGEGPSVKKYTGDGTLLAAWDVQTVHCGNYAIAVDGQGVVYVIDKYGSYGAPNGDGVLRYTSSGGFLGKWPFDGATDIAVEQNGRVHLEMADGGILTLAGDGTIECAWNPGAQAIAAGPSGYVYAYTYGSPSYIAKFGDLVVASHRPTWGSLKAIYR